MKLKSDLKNYPNYITENIKTFEFIEYNKNYKNLKIIKLELKTELNKTLLIKLLKFFDRQYFNFKLLIDNDHYYIKKKRIKRGSFQINIYKNDQLIYKNI